MQISPFLTEIFILAKTGVGKVFLYFIYFLVLLIPLAIIAKLAAATRQGKNIARIDKKIKNVGLEEALIREINHKTVDDSLARAAIGYLAAGGLGLVVGAFSAEMKEKPLSITFWLRFLDGSKDIITLPPDNHFAKRLIALIEKQQFDSW